MVPCGDTEAALDLGQNLTAQIDSGHDHGHSCDECSPFCQCHCCQVHVVHFATNPKRIITPEISSVQPFHFNRRVLDFIPSILQPPKI